MPVLWFVLSALLLLIFLLRVSQWLDTKPSGKVENPPGHGFDAAPLQARLRSVRLDYGKTSLQRHRRTPNHDFIVMAVRRSLAKLSYFRSAQASQTETTERESPEGG
jgi:hypothetical protein